ncbi:hypothetical protein GQ600_1435 [Phytophthora cactorum]|nr:hypothetical protein GQ600_1435 [Phytophthora cactorum]
MAGSKRWTSCSCGVLSVPLSHGSW